LLSTVIGDAWGLLHPDVLAARQVTGRDGLPTTNTRKAILSSVIGVGQKTIARTRGLVRIDDDREAERIRDAIIDAAGLLRAHAVWLTELLHAHDGLLRRHAVGSTLPDRTWSLSCQARVLAEERPEPWVWAEAARADVAHLAVLDVLDQSSGIGPSHLAELVREHGAEFERALAEVWTSGLSSAVRDLRPPSESTRRSARAFVVSSGMTAGPAGATVPLISDEARLHWTSLIEEVGRSGPGSASELDLTSFSAPLRPALTGRLSEERHHPARANHPLDEHIHLRLFRVLKDRRTVYPVDFDLRAAIEATIAASVEPLGLEAAWSRALLVAGSTALVGVTFDGDSASNAHLRQLDGGMRLMMAAWRKAVGEAMHEHPRSVRNPLVMAYLSAPQAYILGKLWTRVLRAWLVERDAPTADRAFGLIYGAFFTAKRQIASVLGLAALEIPADHDLLGRSSADPVQTRALGASDGFEALDDAADPADTSSVTLILETAAETGADVARFVAGVLALEPKAVNDPALVEQWDRWVAARSAADREIERLHRLVLPPLDLPFAIARAFIVARVGPGSV